MDSNTQAAIHILHEIASANEKCIELYHYLSERANTNVVTHQFHIRELEKGCLIDIFVEVVENESNDHVWTLTARFTNAGWTISASYERVIDGMRQQSQKLGDCTGEGKDELCVALQEVCLGLSSSGHKVYPTG